MSRVGLIIPSGSDSAVAFLRMELDQRLKMEGLKAVPLNSFANGYDDKQTWVQETRDTIRDVGAVLVATVTNTRSVPLDRVSQMQILIAASEGKPICTQTNPEDIQGFKKIPQLPVPVIDIAGDIGKLNEVISSEERKTGEK